MGSFGSASSIARLISLAALQASATLGSSDAGNLDQVSWVQTHANISNDMVGEHGLKFRMEDAQSFFDLTMRVVRDPDMGSTLPEKGVALLQNLAKHHSVVSMGHQETLERAAESLRRSAAAAGSEEEGRAGGRAKAGRLPDWLAIASEDIGDRGICWDHFGGKPLQCKVPTQYLTQITDFLPHADRCRKLCFDYDWCSGYGYMPEPPENYEPSFETVEGFVQDKDGGWHKPPQRPEEEFCTLFSNGAEPCPESWETFGLVPIFSSRDLVLRQGYTDIGDEGTGYDYHCYAKYRHDASLGRLISPGVFAFAQLAPVAGSLMRSREGGYCVHREKDKGENRPLHSCKVKHDDYSETSLQGFKSKAIDAKGKDWDTVCERLCAGLEWCAGYTLLERITEPMHSARPEECHLHPNLPDGCPVGHSWENANDRTAAYMPVEDATDIVAGKEEEGVICKSKAQSYKGWFQDKLAPGPKSPMCYLQKGMLYGNAVMAVLYLAGNWDCATRPSTTAGPGFVPGGGVTTTTPGLVFDGGSPRHADHGVRPATAVAKNVSKAVAKNVSTAVAKNASTAVTKNVNRRKRAARLAPNASAVLDASRFGRRHRAVRYRKSSPEGRAALAKILGNDEKTDLSALKLSKKDEKRTCYLLTNGGSARWGLSAVGYWFQKQYQCEEDPDPRDKAKSYCAGDLGRVLGRSLGAGVYGYASIEQNCRGDGIEPHKFFCSLDYVKMVAYFGKAVVKIIIMYVFLSDKHLWERTTSWVDVASAFMFILESIIRTMGPCLGKMKNNPDATIIEDGACIASYLEQVGLSTHAMTSAVSAYNHCLVKQKD